MHAESSQNHVQSIDTVDTELAPEEELIELDLTRDVDESEDELAQDEDTITYLTEDKTTAPGNIGTESAENAVTVTAENLTKHFRHRGELIKAVDGVSFTFTENQFVTIMGPSGSGKSTLLYILGGLDKATSGELTIDDVDVRRLSARQEHLFRRKKLGFIFQSFHLIPNLTALENVMLPMELTGGQSHAKMRERAALLLRQVGINDDRYQHKPGRLSGGQQQRVAIARALANDPRVILADEPTGNLDSRTGKLIIQLLKQLSSRGKTVIVVTHDRSIANVADVRIELEDGKIQEADSNIPIIKNNLKAVPKKKKRRK